MAAASSSFKDAVMGAMRKLYPEELADSRWDNTGLLLDQAPSSTNANPTVLLTNDLTGAVVDEALEVGASVIIAYHPVIFKGLKSLTTKDPMQTSLLRLIAAGISVYCPHTAVDAAEGGVNDWLCDILVAGDAEVSRVPMDKISRPLPQGVDATKVGYGRSFELSQAITLPTLLKRLSTGIGGQRYMMVALPSSMKDFAKAPGITKIGVCAGSGGDMFNGSDAQVLVMGELSHHTALRHTQLGQAVVTVFHSNSERRYLTDVLKPKLEVELKDAKFDSAKVVVSTADSDPYDVVDVESLS